MHDDISLDEHVIRATRRFDPSRVALVDAGSGRSVTYGDFPRLVNCVAHNLARRGLRARDTFMIYAPNSIEFALFFFGAMRVGAVVTTVNPAATRKELEAQLRTSRATWLLSTADGWNSTASALAQHFSAGTVFVVADAALAVPPNTVATALVIADDAARTDDYVSPSRGRDICVLPFSSGTTGPPKGVMLSHGNLLASLRVSEELKDDDLESFRTMILVLPMFHIFGMLVVLTDGLCHGSTLVVLAKFTVNGFLGALQDYRVSRAYLVPPLVLVLGKAEEVARFDLSALRVITCGAAPLGEELVHMVHQRLPNCIVKQAYGLTESSALSHMTPISLARQHSKSIGKLGFSVQGKIVDENGAELGVGHVGEICLKGPTIMQGYFNNPEATAKTLKDGWLHTGDVGSYDAEGWWYLVDRSGEMFKSKGMQVSPAELEALLLSHPAVADAAVISIPHERDGARPKAYIVRKADARISGPELASWMNALVSSYKHLAAVEFIEAIPKTASGKILRRELRAKEAADVQLAAKL